MTYTKKSIYLPCRICTSDEAIGLEGTDNKDVCLKLDKNNLPRGKVVIQFIAPTWFHARKLVRKISLKPFYGNLKGDVVNTTRSYWCNTLTQSLNGYRRKTLRLGEQQVTEGELYLHKLLQHATVARDARMKELADMKELAKCNTLSQSSLIPDIIIPSQKEKETREQTIERLAQAYDDDISLTSQASKETLQCGDVINYYLEGFKWGDAYGRRTATVEFINTDDEEEFVLGLSTGDIIYKDSMILRVEKLVNGSLIENKQKRWKSQTLFKLKKDVRNTQLSIKKRANRTSDIIAKAQDKFKSNVKSLGLGDCTGMMTPFKKPKKK